MITIKKYFFGKTKKEAQDNCSKHLDTLSTYQLENMIAICVFTLVTPDKCRCFCEYPEKTEGKSTTKLFEMMQGGKEGYVFFCPGCNSSHTLLSLTEGDKRISGDNICHFHVENNKIEFFNDCTHSLKGQTVTLDVISKLNVTVRT